MTPRTGLRISQKLTLPLELITDRAMILATTGAGKTYLMRVVVEEVLKANQQVVVLDPKGDFWGLRSSVDGKSPGFPIPVFGGEHADLPLEEGSGAFIAELIVNERLSAILDMSLFSKTKMLAWATEFAEQFYHRNREAMMLAIDELHTFAPQKFKGHERMLGAFTDLFGKGRKRGIGTLGASQRSALVNKDVLDLTATMFFLRTGSPRDRDVVDDWLQYNASAEVRKQIMGELPKLENGATWVYSPHSFKLLERIMVREAQTFDSSATPKPGQAVRKPKTLAEIDVGAVSTQMSEAIERAKADDPKELRKRIAELQRDLRDRPESEPQEVEIPVPVVNERAIELAKELSVEASEVQVIFNEELPLRVKRIQETADRLVALAQDVGSDKRANNIGAKVTPKRPLPVSRPQMREQKRNRQPDQTVTAQASEDVPPSRQRILDALAWMESIGRDRTAKSQLALLADQRPTSGGYKNNLGALRSAGLIDYPQASWVSLTDQGRAIATAQGVPTTSDELQAQIFAKLGPSRTRILKALIGEYPAAITKDDLAEMSDQTPTSGGYKNNLGFMRTMGLIDYPSPGYVAAEPILFLE